MDAPPIHRPGAGEDRLSHSRIYIPPGRWAPDVKLESAERRYLVDVLRLAPGDPVEVFDGSGWICLSQLARSGRTWTLVMGERVSKPDPFPTTALGVALTKGKKIDRVVRMVTELGISTIEPFTSSRSVSRPGKSGMEGKVARWLSIASEAARQSGRSSIPEIKPIRTLEELFEQSTQDMRVILHAHAGGVAFELLPGCAHEESRLVLVGPEGGFSASEIDLAMTHGFAVAHLNLPVLRSDTAAVVAAAFACLDRRPSVR
jgi:16S rRNA (uracil1498-N3)-methyltransferase